ncbi:ankyrin repeat domain-containing protein [bacterium]
MFSKILTLVLTCIIIINPSINKINLNETKAINNNALALQTQFLNLKTKKDKLNFICVWIKKLREANIPEEEIRNLFLKMSQIYPNLKEALVLYEQENIKEFMQACKTGKIKKVKRLVKANKNIVNARYKKNKTGLHFAAGNGRLGIVKYLIEKGADVNARTDSNMTALHYASLYNYIETVEYLVASKIDINIKNNKKMDAANLALKYGSKYVYDYLYIKKLANERNKNWLNKKSVSPNKLTCEFKENDLLKFKEFLQKNFITKKRLLLKRKKNI